MAASGAIRAGRAYVEMTLDKSQLERGLEAVQRSLSRIGASLKAVGAQFLKFGGAVVGGLLAATKAFASTGAAIDDLSRRTGLSAEAVSALAFAADQSGTSLTSLENGIRRMQRGITDGSAAFEELGLNVEEMRQWEPSEQFLRIADAISLVSDPTRKASLAMDVFGKSGTQLLPMFEGGADGLRDFAKQAERLGLIMSTEDARAAGELDDALAALWGTVKKLIVGVGAALAPAITDLSSRAQEMTSSAVAWVTENRALIVTMAQVAVGVTAAGAALYAFGVAANVASLAVKALTVALNLLTKHPLVALGVGIAAVTLYALDSIGAFDGLKKSFGDFTDRLGQKLGIIEETADGLKDIADNAAAAAAALEAASVPDQMDAAGRWHDVGAPAGQVDGNPIQALAERQRIQQEQAAEARRLATIREQERWMREDAPFLLSEFHPDLIGPRQLNPAAAGRAGSLEMLGRMRLGELSESPAGREPPSRSVFEKFAATPFRSASQQVGTFSSEASRMFFSRGDEELNQLKAMNQTLQSIDRKAGKGGIAVGV